MNVTDAREIERVAKASGLIAMINFEFRFEPLRLQIRDMLSEGAIGTFRHATIELDTTNPLVSIDRCI